MRERTVTEKLIDWLIERDAYIERMRTGALALAADLVRLSRPNTVATVPDGAGVLMREDVVEIAVRLKTLADMLPVEQLEVCRPVPDVNGTPHRQAGHPGGPATTKPMPMCRCGHDASSHELRPAFGSSSGRCIIVGGCTCPQFTGAAPQPVSMGSSSAASAVLPAENRAPGLNPEMAVSSRPPSTTDPYAEIATLRAGIEAALKYANGRWCEWGGRAEATADILEQALANPAPQATVYEAAKALADAYLEETRAEDVYAEAVQRGTDGEVDVAGQAWTKTKAVLAERRRAYEQALKDAEEQK